MRILLGLVFSYLLGSIPTAYLFGKIYKGIDIRQYGSGNVGATNAFRTLGKIPGTLVLLIDTFKGLLAVTLIGNLFHPSSDNIIWRIVLGLGVVSGHNWTIFLNFKGGKGMTTSLGVLIGLTIKFPELLIVLLICLGIWAFIFLSSGYVSLSSLAAASALPIIMIVTNQPVEMKILGAVFCVFVIIRHQANIKRLMAGTESRVKFLSRNKK